jgi:chemotaxis protein methyltransferase CheR
MNRFQLTTPSLSDQQFDRIRALMQERASIDLALTRKVLVVSRLAQRLRQLNMAGFDEYLELIDSGRDPAEMHQLIDLLTTHETYFFREPEHFDHLAKVVVPARVGQPVRVWSAASSTGEEAYSVAMTLMTAMGPNLPWEVVGTDVSRDAVRRASRGVYRADRLDQVPKGYVGRYCRRDAADERAICITPAIRSRVSFQAMNLAAPLTGLGMFDVIFLRNVLIYFDKESRTQILDRICQQLKPGGWLVLGHAEIMCARPHGMRQENSTIYRKPAGKAVPIAKPITDAPTSTRSKTPDFAMSSYTPTT